MMNFEGRLYDEVLDWEVEMMMMMMEIADDGFGYDFGGW